jgi:hypothetical protein
MRDIRHSHGRQRGAMSSGGSDVGSSAKNAKAESRWVSQNLDACSNITCIFHTVTPMSLSESGNFHVTLVHGIA